MFLILCYWYNCSAWCECDKLKRVVRICDFCDQNDYLFIHSLKDPSSCTPGTRPSGALLKRCMNLLYISNESIVEGVASVDFWIERALSTWK